MTESNILADQDFVGFTEKQLTAIVYGFACGRRGKPVHITEAVDLVNHFIAMKVEIALLENLLLGEIDVDWDGADTIWMACQAKANPNWFLLEERPMPALD